MDCEAPAVEKPATDATVLLELMFRLGQAQIACGEQTARIELLLRRIASAYGMRRSRVVVFPTAVFITLHDGAQERVTLSEGPSYGLRLDQIADVYALSKAATERFGSWQPQIGRVTNYVRRAGRRGG